MDLRNIIVSQLGSSHEPFGWRGALIMVLVVGALLVLKCRLVTRYGD